MARFYLDENVAEALVAALGQLKHEAVSTTQMGRNGARDPQQLNTAVDLDRILVTHNEADFRLLHEAWRSWSSRWGVTTSANHPGILVLPQIVGLSVPAMAVELHALVTTQDSVANQLLIRSRSGAWVEDQ